MNPTTEKPAGRPSIAVIPKGALTGNPDILMHTGGEFAQFPGNLSSRRAVMGIYEKMMLDDRISQVMSVVNSSVRTLEWYVESEDTDAADFVRENLRSLDIGRFIGNLLSARVYGFAVFEEVWKNENGRYRIIDERLLPARKVEFVADEFAQLVTVKYDSVEYPVEWFHVFTYPDIRPDSYHYGTSDLKKIYREWYTKDVLKRYRNLGLENYAFPIVVVTFDENRYRPGTPEWDALQAMVEGIKDDARLTLPGALSPIDGSLMPGVEVKFLEPRYADGGFEALEKAIGSEDKAIARNLGLPDDLGFTDTPAGSYAKARQEFDMFWKNITDIAETVEASIRKVVERLTGHNYPCAKVRFGFEVSRDKGITAQKAEVLKTLAEAGLTLDKGFTARYLNISETELSV